MFSTRAMPSLKTNHYTIQLSASVNNKFYHTRSTREVNCVTPHLSVMLLYIRSTGTTSKRATA
jgi:hypothetical protein